MLFGSCILLPLTWALVPIGIILVYKHIRSVELLLGLEDCLTILVIEELCDNFARLGVRARSTNTMSSFYDKVGTDFRHVS